ncbi:PREDICTED: putative defensin-like protein 110 [Camelina sativa]|uniref:Defensin-like protein 110 n=1 Tax=Camelina sativa TaxID=90675 RepID=A0ABM1QXN1_CAMSA|nr:PREDICTED: putative defensin-like protein 110 [Camelina sativa]
MSKKKRKRKMAITKKNLIAFVLTILVVISSIHCRTTSDIVSGFGIKESDHVCFNVTPCLPEQGGDKGCNAFCSRMKFKIGHCLHSGKDTGICCCYST